MRERKAALKTLFIISIIALQAVCRVTAFSAELMIERMYGDPRLASIAPTGRL